MSVGLEYVHLDTQACTHPAPAALLRLMGTSLFCGHCGSDLPEFLHHTLVRCDGTAVTVTQDDFGRLHRCGEQDAITGAVESLVDLTAPTL